MIRYSILPILICAYAVLCGSASTIRVGLKTPSLDSESIRISFPHLHDGGYGIELDMPHGEGHSFPFVQLDPLSVAITDAQGRITWLRGCYRTVSVTKYGLVAAGRVQSPNGSVFLFNDAFHRDAKNRAIVMSRRVRIIKASAKDLGFATRFYLPAYKRCFMKDFDFLVPGIWYKRNDHAPSYALASNLSNRNFFFREDRTPLPFVMMRHRETGITLLLLHLHGDPVTFSGDRNRDPVISSEMRFGSVGVRNRSNPGVAFWYPGSEGKGTYLPKGDTSTQWAYRYHPAKSGFEQRYSLLLKMSHTKNYPDAVRRSWLLAWSAYHPTAPKSNPTLAYRDCMKLIESVCHPYNGVDDIPFELTVPSGKVPQQGALSGEMGFAGQQIPACAMALRYGYDTHNTKLVNDAGNIVDFWVRNAAAPSGVLRTWYDITPDGKRVWRNYPMYLRVASDGLNGVLEAWDVAIRHGVNHPSWLRFARLFGDWLVRNQGADGSFLRTYDFNDAPINIAKDTTDQPIAFLVNLALITGDVKYLGCAEKAGEYSLKTVNERYDYVGGTPDNPNVTDKEAGAIAMESFLALYDVTRNARYLQAAIQAAWFTETWTYGWNIPMPANDPLCDFPKSRSTVGISLIATGHSGADNFMAREIFNYYRLYLLTGETQFRDFTQVIQGNSERMMDMDRSLGYAMPGLQIEAMTLSIPRGRSVRMWLPWLTVGMLEPMIRLQETFGSKNLVAIQRLPLQAQKTMSDRFGKTQGFSKVPGLNLLQDRGRRNNRLSSENISKKGGYPRDMEAIGSGNR